MNYDARFCFVVFEDLEQNEPGDTLTHTFTWTGWEYCQTRYFYFWSTAAGIPLVSTSCIFQKHSTYVPIEQTLYFYSDPSPEVTSVDGMVFRIQGWPAYDTWAGIRNGAGTGSHDSAPTCEVDLKAPSAANKWAWIYRTLHLFDTTEITVDKTILEASLSIWMVSHFNNFALKPSLGVYATNPASNTALVPADYQTFADTLLSSVIDYDTFAASVGPHEMVFNAIGRGAIAKGGITKLGIRDATRDGPNSPHWESNKYCALVFASAETATPAQRPVLMVKFI